MNIRSFLKAGHTPSLVCAFLHFDVSFMVWVLIGALANSIVPEFQLNESQRGLMPPRVQPDQTGITGELESANDAARRQEPKNGDHSQAQPREPGMDRKAGSLRPNRVLQPYV